MKYFSEKDINHAGGVCPTIYCDKDQDLLLNQLPWQKTGLQQTASGYGGKLTTSYKISYEGKLYRIYCTCYGNSGSCWFVSKGMKIWVN